MDTEKTITIKGKWSSRRVWIDGNELLPDRSQELCNHSPDGFNWGYCGSGPAQLALAILLEYTDVEVALRNYQNFKMNIIAALHQKEFSTTVSIGVWTTVGVAIGDEES